MTEDTLKSKLGSFMVICHFCIILLIVVFRLIEYFDDSTLKVSLPIVIPLFATYTTLVVRNMIANRNKVVDTSRQMNKNYVFISFFITIIFVLAILGITLKQGLKPSSIESFAVLLGIGESVFGIYLGYIFKDLFSSDETPPSTPVNPAFDPKPLNLK